MGDDIDDIDDDVLIKRRDYAAAQHKKPDIPLNVSGGHIF